MTRWLEEVSRYAPEGTLKILIGNKKDLELERVVTYDTGAAYAKTLDIPFIETSAKFDDKTAIESNVEEAFRIIATNLRNKNTGNINKNTNSSSDTTKLTNDSGKSKSSCC